MGIAIESSSFDVILFLPLVFIFGHINSKLLVTFADITLALEIQFRTRSFLEVISVPSLIKTYRACSLQVIQTLSCYLIGRINEWKCYVTTSLDLENTIYFDTIRYYLIVFVDVINGVSRPFGQEKWLRNAFDQSNSKIRFE